MKKILLQLILFLLFISKSNAQVPVFDWVSQLGSQGAGAYVGDYTIDNDGHSITVGRFGYTSDFDPGPGVFNMTATYFGSHFISKLDSNGNFVWAKQINFNDFNSAYGSLDVSTDSFGNIFLLGQFRYTVDFDPGPLVFNMTSVGTTYPNNYILKLNPNGSFAWAKNVGTNNICLTKNIHSTQEGDLFLTGYFSDTFDFDPGSGIYNLVPNGVSNIYLSKFDVSGNFIWARGFGSSDDYNGPLLDSDNFGNVYLTGSFNATSDFDPGTGVYNLISSGWNTKYLCKFDFNGNFNWATSFPSCDSVEFSAIEIDNSHNIYITGDFYYGWNPIDIDPGIGSTLINGYDGSVFILKLDSASNFLWVKQIGAIDSLVITYNNFKPTDVSSDIAGNIYAIGYFNAPVDFDPGNTEYILTPVYDLTNGYLGAIWLLKLSSNGIFNWVKSFGGNSEAYELLSINVSKSNAVYSSGNWFGVMDFDPGNGIDTLYSGVGGVWTLPSAFVHKMSQCNPTYGFINISTCNSYISPSGFYTWTTSGIYNDVIPNSVGCDSLITINLTISNCPVPTNIGVTNIQSTKSTINWTGNPCAIKYRIQIRVQGTTAWTTLLVTAPTSFKTITPLSPSTTYEYRVRTDCNATGTFASSYSAIQTFTTSCSCTKPTGITITNLTQTTAKVNWVGNTCALKYRLQYRKQGTTTWTTKTITAPTQIYNIIGLTNNNIYEYHLRSDCNSSGSVNSGWTTTNTFVTPLRIEDAEIETAIFYISPNPCNTCEIIGTTNATDLTVTDIVGRKINASFSKSVNGFYINFPENTNGIFFIRNIKTGEVVKFVRE